MNVLTKDEHGKDQWWFIQIKDIDYPDLRRTPECYLTESEIFKKLDTLTWNNFSFIPVINAEETLNYENIRGSITDSTPFMLRKRVIGRVVLHIEIYYPENVLSMRADYFNNYDNWNFTDGQRKFIKEQYKDQLLAHCTDKNLALLRKKYTKMLACNVLEKCRHLDSLSQYLTKVCMRRMEAVSSIE